MGHNILSFGIIAITINLLIGIMVVTIPILTSTHPYDITQGQINQVITGQQTQAQQWDKDHITTGLCRTGDTTCNTELTSQTTADATAQSPLDTFFNIFGYFGKALLILAAIPFVGIFISTLANTPIPALNYLIILFGVAWNITTIYLILKMFIGTTRIW